MLGQGGAVLEGGNMMFYGFIIVLIILFITGVIDLIDKGNRRALAGVDMTMWFALLAMVVMMYRYGSDEAMDPRSLRQNFS